MITYELGSRFIEHFKLVVELVPLVFVEQIDDLQRVNQYRCRRMGQTYFDRHADTRCLVDPFNDFPPVALP